MDDKNIIIKQSYFTNIQTSINSINEFFSSQFKTKNFPVLDEGLDVDPTVERILSRLNAVDSSWVFDENKFQDMLNTINSELEKIDPEGGVYQTLIDSNNETLIQAVESYIGFKVLNMIADNFDAFTKFINGIYTFEVFYKPSEYNDALNVFDQFIQFDEVPALDLEEKIFDDGFYVDGLFKNGDVSLPEELTVESETERITNRQDLEGYEILVDDTVQEAAEINYFENDKPQNMKYSDSQKKFLISNEFSAAVDELVAGLRKCDSTDDLLKFFQDPNVIPKLASRMSRTVIPFILVKVLTNPKKTATDLSPTLKKYTDSYASILSQNVGARRFENYDLFSTFKSDKEGTIKFVEDFCKLRLVNDSDASIANNTLLTIFNIFDSRIYLDLAYNVAPESIKQEKIEDAFVKDIRGKINKNSRTKTAYTEEAPTETDETGAPTETKPDTTETVNEYVSMELMKFGTMTHNDMRYCDQFAALIEKEIDTIDDRMYNEHVSPILVDEYIGESYEYIMEATTEENHNRLNTAVGILMDDMKRIVKLSKEKKWTNNACLSMFRAGETLNNVKQARKYVDRAIAGSGGVKVDNIDKLKELLVKIKELLTTVKGMKLNPLVHKNVKESMGAQKVAMLAGEIVKIESSLSFLKDAPVKERPTDKKEEEAEAVTESAVMDFDEFMVVMEGAPEDGSIPNYMKNRIALSDDMKTSTVPVGIPDGVPQNPVPDLVDSINTKLDTKSDNINDMLGSGYTPATKSEEARTVINITNNYTNSFNKDSNNTTTSTDSSTGKVINTTTTNTNSNNDSSNNKDASHNKRTTTSTSNKTDTSGSNNNNNSSTSADLKDSKNEKKFSNGKTVQEMFMFLESKEPQSGRSDAGKPPKEDSLTKAMDRDRKLLPKQQGAKKATTKVLNTGKAVLKPVSRTKQWINNVVNSVIKRDEDQVKAEMFDNPSYRSAVLKAARLATKLGLTGVLTALNPYLGVAYVGVQGLKLADRKRLREEMGEELMTELEVTEQKIRDLSGHTSPEALKQKYELMRTRQKLIDKIPQTKRSHIKRPSDVAF